MRKAVAEKDPVKRLAYVSVYRCVYMTNVEKGVVKPFNPLLGETYELFIPGKFKFIAEQVSHHPPICAYDCQGEAGYRLYGTYYPRSKFTKGNLVF
jgi:hypothetical protein